MTSSSTSPLLTAALFGGFVLAAGGIVYYNYKQKKDMDSLAAKNGWQPLPANDATLWQYVPQHVQTTESIGHRYHLAYQARVGATDIAFFRYDNQRPTHEMNTANAASETVSYAIASFAIPQSLGTMVILHHSLLGSIGLHPGLQKFNLEGDFNDHYDVYALPDSQIETLSIMTPDFMAFLIDSAGYHRNIQISGNRVSIEGDAQQITASHCSELLSYCGALSDKLRAKASARTAVAPVPPTV